MIENNHPNDVNNYLGTPCGQLLEGLRYYEDRLLTVMSNPQPYLGDDHTVEELQCILRNICEQLEEVGYVISSRTRSLF